MRDNSTNQRAPSQRRKSSRDSVGTTLMWFAIPAVIIGISIAYVLIFEQADPLTTETPRVETTEEKQS